MMIWWKMMKWLEVIECVLKARVIVSRRLVPTFHSTGCDLDFWSEYLLGKTNEQKLVCKEKMHVGRISVHRVTFQHMQYHHCNHLIHSTGLCALSYDHLNHFILWWWFDRQLTFVYILRSCCVGRYGNIHTNAIFWLKCSSSWLETGNGESAIIECWTVSLKYHKSSQEWFSSILVDIVWFLHHKWTMNMKWRTNEILIHVIWQGARR
jgi:hypothetical protein